MKLVLLTFLLVMLNRHTLVQATRLHSVSKITYPCTVLRLLIATLWLLYSYNVIGVCAALEYEPASWAAKICGCIIPFGVSNDFSGTEYCQSLPNQMCITIVILCEA